MRRTKTAWAYLLEGIEMTIVECRRIVPTLEVIHESLTRLPSGVGTSSLGIRTHPLHRPHGGWSHAHHADRSVLVVKIWLVRSALVVCHHFGKGNAMDLRCPVVAVYRGVPHGSVERGPSCPTPADFLVGVGIVSHTVMRNGQREVIPHNSRKVKSSRASIHVYVAVV